VSAGVKRHLLHCGVTVLALHVLLSSADDDDVDDDDACNQVKMLMLSISHAAVLLACFLCSRVFSNIISNCSYFCEV